MSQLDIIISSQPRFKKDGKYPVSHFLVMQRAGIVNCTRNTKWINVLLIHNTYLPQSQSSCEHWTAIKDSSRERQTSGGEATPRDGGTGHPRFGTLPRLRVSLIAWHTMPIDTQICMRDFIVDLHSFFFKNGLSALHKAAKWGHTNVVKQLLLSKRFDVNEQDKVSISLPHARVKGLQQFA